MKDSKIEETADFSDVSARLEEVTKALANVAARLDELEGGTSPRIGKKMGKQSRHVADAVLEYIEAHPVRATAIGFLLGALLFRGRG